MRIFSLLSVLTLPLLAQDGGQLYGLYCSACHGADGKGATGGQFPPLAESPWVLGNAERPIKIVLHGIHQPIEVNGKTYNLEMPPQGAALTDDHIAAILTYVRASWGNKDSAVSIDQVKKVRAATASRNQHWTAEELLKLHPLETEEPPLANLISYYYKGKFPSLPDFSELKPDAVEEEPTGTIDYSSYANTDHFAMVWEGELETPGGKHDFSLDSDDCSRLFIDGNLVAEIKTPGGMGRTVKKALSMLAGVHEVRVEYMELTNKEGLAVGVKFQNENSVRWLSKDKGMAWNKRWPEIMLKPTGGRPVIYRNFIQGTTARGIGVGFPGAVNLAYSADHCTMELLWPGNFIDAGRHWTDRGIGFEPPAGDQVFAISKQRAFAFASETTASWPAASEASMRFRGYQLSTEGNPTFITEVANAKVLDRYQALPGQKPALQRVVQLDGKASVPITLLICQGPFKDNQPNAFSIGACNVTVEGAAFRYLPDLVVLDLSNAAATLRYTW
jgi:mono/diheme cytochrome c family protein